MSCDKSSMLSTSVRLHDVQHWKLNITPGVQYRKLKNTGSPAPEVEQLSDERGIRVLAYVSL